MYLEHFGLERRPFAATAEGIAYYPSTGQEDAVRLLLDAFCSQEGFAVLHGEPGCGKTAAALRLLDQLGEVPTVCWLTNTHFPDVAAMFQTILYELGESYQGGGEHELRLRLTDFLMQRYAEQHPTVMVVDEAHLLSVPMLEELRLLGNLESFQCKLVQFCLIGLPELMTTLRDPHLSCLAQRIHTRASLGPMDVHEAVDYLLHHLRAAGGRAERIITVEALELLARGARGLPRLLNQAADQALRLAFAAEQQQVDAEAVVETLQDLGLSLDADEESLHSPRPREGRASQVEDLVTRDFRGGVPSPKPTINATGSGTKPRRLFGSLKKPA